MWTGEYALICGRCGRRTWKPIRDHLGGLYCPSCGWPRLNPEPPPPPPIPLWRAKSVQRQLFDGPSTVHPKH